MLPTHDYSRNYQNLNPFADTAMYDGEKTLPDWFTGGANKAKFTKGYYFPKPNNERFNRNMTKSENENTHILRIQNKYKERDPWYDQMQSFNNVANYGPGNGTRFGDLLKKGDNANLPGSGNNPNYFSLRAPESTIGKWSAQPLTYSAHDWDITLEERRRERLPDNYAVDMVPRARNNEAVYNPLNYASASSFRTAPDKVKVDRINTTFHGVVLNEHDFTSNAESAFLKNKVFDERSQIPEIQNQYKDTCANRIGNIYKPTKDLRDHWDQKHDGRGGITFSAYNRNLNMDPNGMQARRKYTGHETVYESRPLKPVYGNDYNGKFGTDTNKIKDVGKTVNIKNHPAYRTTYYDEVNGKIGLPETFEGNNVSKKRSEGLNCSQNYKMAVKRSNN